MLSLRIALFLLGAMLVTGTVISAIRTFVVPRGLSDVLTSVIFRSVRRVFDIWAHSRRTYAQRDRVMAFYAPVTLLLLPGMWLALILLGYMGIFFALGAPDPFAASGSSLLTLGFAPLHGTVQTVFAFTEAAFGLALVALLIAYLPAMYSAFQRRETLVTLLETEAGAPPSPQELLIRYHILGRLERLHDLWQRWYVWFADVAESHTSLAPLIYYRSPRPDRSWVTAAGALLDTASIVTSTLDLPRDPTAEFCIRSGYLCLQQVLEVLGVATEHAPHFPRNPISVTRAEYDTVVDALEAAGLPIKADREQAWIDFAGWRVNYDRALLSLAGLTVAPPAVWSSDRAAEWRLPILRRLPPD